MYKHRLHILPAFALGLLLITAGCRKKDVPPPDNVASFESETLGIEENAAGVTIKISLSRATDKDIPVKVTITPQGVTYGEEFTTTPAVTGSTLNLTIPAGASGTSFEVKKAAGAMLYGDEQIEFKIESTGAPVIIGNGNSVTVKFAEVISAGSTLSGDGGGANYTNKVFFDLSANTQTAVSRAKWDLGFYSGDKWRVILNSSLTMMAKQLDKNDLNAVTKADTAGLADLVSFGTFDPASLAYMDYPDGDLGRTAIAEVSANDADNKVYIVNMGNGVGANAAHRGWKKVRVLRSSKGGYTLQYANIGDASFKTLEIPKNNAYFFNYVSFENGLVEVEPQKNKWDIAWTYFANVTSMGALEVPYPYQDIIIQNRNVEIAKVMAATKAYADFSEADIAGQTFSGGQTTIGAGWRSGGGPGSAPAVYSDRYFILKDADGNYYKFRFTAMTKNGERGYPAFEYQLVKKG